MAIVCLAVILKGPDLNDKYENFQAGACAMFTSTNEMIVQLVLLLQSNADKTVELLSRVFVPAALVDGLHGIDALIQLQSQCDVLGWKPLLWFQRCISHLRKAEGLQ